jgi:quercetin dioxygenase-like cupin family protein
MKRSLLILVFVLFAAFGLYGLNLKAEAGGSGIQSSSHVMQSPDQIKWNKSGTGLDFALISGDPQKEGAPFVVRFKLSDGSKVAPHWHPVDEHVTVISGTFFMGEGEKFNESAAHEMKAGAYALMPKETRHFAWAKGETVIQIHGIGPFKTFWVNSNQ